MIVRPPSERPVVFAIAVLDRQVVDAGDTQPHQAVLVELPVLVAIAAEPVSTVVMPFVGEAYGNPIAVKGPNLLDQSIVELLGPLAGQERLDGLPTLEEFGAIAPAAVGRIGQRNTGRIARVPRVLGHADLLSGCFSGERRKRRTAFGCAHRSDR